MAAVWVCGIWARSDKRDKFHSHRSRPYDLSYGISPDGKTIAYPQGSVLHQIDTTTGKPVIATYGHETSITATAFSPIDSVIATGDFDGRIILWEGSTGNGLRQLGESAGAVRELTFDPRGNLLFALFQRSRFGIGIGGNDESTLRAFNVADGKEAWNTSYPINVGPSGGGPRGQIPESVSAMAITGDELALLQTDAIVMLEAKTGKVRLTPSRLQYRPEFSYVFGNATALTYTKQRNELLVWSLRQMLWRGDWAMNRRMAIQPCDDAMRATTPDNLLSGISGNGPRSATFSADGKFLALGGDETFIQLINIETGKEAIRIPRGNENKNSDVSHIVFAPDSRTLFWSEDNESFVHSAEVSSGKTLRKIPVLGGRATSLALSPDGKSLVVGCADSTATVWELAKLAGSN